MTRRTSCDAVFVMVIALCISSNENAGFSSRIAALIDVKKVKARRYLPRKSWYNSYRVQRPFRCETHPYYSIREVKLCRMCLRSCDCDTGVVSVGVVTCDA
jgi:hypothetical protein